MLPRTLHDLLIPYIVRRHLRKRTLQQGCNRWIVLKQCCIARLVNQILLRCLRRLIRRVNHCSGEGFAIVNVRGFEGGGDGYNLDVTREEVGL